MFLESAVLRVENIVAGKETELHQPGVYIGYTADNCFEKCCHLFLCIYLCNVTNIRFNFGLALQREVQLHTSGIIYIFTPHLLILKV